MPWVLCIRFSNLKKIYGLRIRVKHGQIYRLFYIKKHHTWWITYDGSHMMDHISLCVSVSLMIFHINQIMWSRWSTTVYEVEENKIRSTQLETMNGWHLTYVQHDYLTQLRSHQFVYEWNFMHFHITKHSQVDQVLLMKLKKLKFGNAPLESIEWWCLKCVWHDYLAQLKCLCCVVFDTWFHV